MFANQPQGYCTNAAEGTSTFYHSQTGDLHAPGMGMGMVLGLRTTLPLPTSDDGVQAGWMVDICGPPQTAQFRKFHNFNLFAPHQSFALHHYSHWLLGFESINVLRDGFPAGESGIDIDTEMLDDSPTMNFSSRPYDASMSAPPLGSSEK
jgi:hypothetical protein